MKKKEVTNETQAPILTKPSWGKLQEMQNAEIVCVSPPRRCKNDEASGAWVWSKSVAGFGQNRRLGFICFELSGLLEISHHCVTKLSPLGSVSMNENRVQ